MRQTQFDAFLAKQDAIQRNCVNNGRIVIYKIHKESGLGNMIRGYLTAFVVAILTDRGVQGRREVLSSSTVKAPREFFFKFFFPPFPNMSGRTSSRFSSCSSHVVIHLHGNFSIWDYFPKRSTVQRLKTEPFSTWWNTSAVIMTTYSDVTARFLTPALYGKSMQEIGVLSSSRPPPKNTMIGEAFRSAVLPLLLNPNFKLCRVINKHIRVLRRRGTMIGVQMRLGGEKANYPERMFLGPRAVAVFAEKVQAYAKKNALNSSNSVVFVSTDSDFALKELRGLLQAPGESWVYSVKDWEIGHSAMGKSQGFGDKKRESFMNRAILDLMLLKESDFLIYSQGSSYGLIATELQQVYRYPVNASAFLKSKGLKCSVFHPRKQFGEAIYVSKYFAKKKKK